MKTSKRQLRRIIRKEKSRLAEALDSAARDVAIEVMEDTLNNLYWEEGFTNEELKSVLLQLLKHLDQGFIGEPT